MNLTDVVTIKKVTAESRTATGAEKTYEDVVVRGALKDISPQESNKYQTQGYSEVEKQIVVYDRKELPSESVDFSGYVEVMDSRTGTEVNYDIITPAVRRGNYLVFGVKNAEY